MVKATEKITGEQQNMDFSFLAGPALDDNNAPPLDMDTEICVSIKKAIRLSHRSREQIVDRMNLCFIDSDYEVTLRKLNAWLAPSQGDKRFPAWAISAVCWATGSMLPLVCQAHAVGHEISDPREQQAQAYGQALIEEQVARRKAAELKKQWSK